MKCIVMVSSGRLGGIPIAECGGSVLAERDELIVTEDLAARLKRHYGPSLIEAGTLEKTTLSSGQYEVVRKGASAFAADPRGKLAPVVSSVDDETNPVAGVAVDKSMITKRARRKG